MSGATSGTVTIWAQDGSSYTLDPAARELESNDGRVVYLSPEQAAFTATAFRAVLESDTLTALVEQDQCPHDIGSPVCIEPEFAPIEGPSTERALGRSGRTLHLSSKSLLSRLVRVPVEAPISGIASVIQPQLGAGAQTSSLYEDWPPSCLEIATELYEASSISQGSRLLLVGAIGSIFGSTFSFDATGRPTFTLPSVGQIAFELEVAAAEVAHHALNLRILASLYTAYGCWNDDWPDATDPFEGTGTGGGSSGGGAMNEVCQWFQLIVSHDGGQTWENYGSPFEECHYERIQTQ